MLTWRLNAKLAWGRRARLTRRDYPSQYAAMLVDQRWWNTSGLKPGKGLTGLAGSASFASVGRNERSEGAAC